MQREWIGRSEGARVKFPLLPAGVHTPPDGRAAGDAPDIEVFTTRIDTIFGATFVLLAPEHEWIERIADESVAPDAFRQHVQRFRAQDRTARLTRRGREGGLLHRPLRASTRSPAARCRSGSRTSCSASTAPAP